MNQTKHLWSKVALPPNVFESPCALYYCTQCEGFRLRPRNHTQWHYYLPEDLHFVHLGTGWSKCNRLRDHVLRERERKSFAVVPSNPSVLQDWVTGLTFMQQTVLLAAIRGPDGQPKYGGGAKMLLRWYRRCVVKSAMEKRVITNPYDPGGGSFSGPSIKELTEQTRTHTDPLPDEWEPRMQEHINDYLRQLDMLPHYYQMHFMHAAEIIGYKHPDQRIRTWWHNLYVTLVHDMHVWPETEEQLDQRLGDNREGWLARNHPATTK